MVAELTERNFAPSFVPAARGDVGAGSFAGDLSSLSAFELLQIFQYLGKCGTLGLESHGEVATCEVVPRGLCEVECGRLRGLDAALAFVWWKEGTFRFDTHPGCPAVPDETIAVQQLLLDAVQMADEIEARNALIPGRLEPLYRLLHQPTPAPLRAVRGASEVLAYLQARPGAARRDLERALPFAPMTVGFAVARLAEEGYVGARERAQGQSAAAPVPARAQRIARALFAFDPEHAGEADAALHRVEERLGAVRSTGQIDAATPSFWRTRLPSGCFLSLTALPISRRNRFVLESLAPSLGLALLWAGSRLREEAERWRCLLPPGVLVVQTETPEEAAREIEAAVRRLETDEIKSQPFGA